MNKTELIKTILKYCKENKIIGFSDIISIDGKVYNVNMGFKDITSQLKNEQAEHKAELIRINKLFDEDYSIYEIAEETKKSAEKVRRMFNL